MKTDKFVATARELGIDPLNIWDIGSFNGEQAVELAEAFPKARVLALEADPYNIPKCTPRTQANDRIQLVNAALAPLDSPRLINFNRSIGQNDQVGSLLRPSDPEDYRTKPIMVPAVTANDLSIAFGHPDLLWMDVQGTELDFFDGQFVRPKLVWLEVAYRKYYHGQPLEKDVDRLMEQLGYRALFRHVEAPDWFGDVCYLYGS